jgi:hypothetical protein
MSSRSNQIAYPATSCNCCPAGGQQGPTTYDLSLTHTDQFNSFIESPRHCYVLV